MEKKLEVRSLRISFRTVSGKLQAVRGIDFNLYKGETLAIVGESGSGKSVTSKAILGILAGNSIVEGGEILYDGQDLLKIKEDDFYRLRGDKIAMIFQDPLSSLNPIMRVGKQLTEAMLLKGKARQRSSRIGFSEKLKRLEADMCSSDPERAGRAHEMCEKYKKYETRHIKLEQAYNAAVDAANETVAEIDALCHRVEKNAVKDLREHVNKLLEFAPRSVNPYVVSNQADRLTALCKELRKGIGSRLDADECEFAAQKATEIKKIITAGLDQTKPDFSALGYFEIFGTGEKPDGDMQKQNEFYVNVLNEQFMNEFSALVENAIRYGDEKYSALRNTALEQLKNAETVILKGVEAFKPVANALCLAVDASINPIDIIKDSAACTFSSSLKDFIATYDRGVRTNGKKQREYEKQVARYKKLEQAGKKPDWKVTQASVIDLDLVRDNIQALIDRLSTHYEALRDQEGDRDKEKKARDLLDYLSQSASGMVLRITKHAARNRALKLLEEVGIDDPRRRYRQYPFEFSGGMRQRIVIAIALAANPDILICDEPTTALDVTIQAQILELINKLKNERKLTIIFITHDLGVVANMADRIAVMYAGKIVEYGTSEEVFYQPAHPYTWALLSSMPDLDTKEKLEAIPGTPPNMIYPPKGDAFAERNRYAMQIDFEREPPAFTISETHWAATWLLHPNAPKVEMPKTVTERIEKMKQKNGGAVNV